MSDKENEFLVLRRDKKWDYTRVPNQKKAVRKVLKNSPVPDATIPENFNLQLLADAAAKRSLLENARKNSNVATKATKSSRGTASRKKPVSMTFTTRLVPVHVVQHLIPTNNETKDFNLRLLAGVASTIIATENIAMITKALETQRSLQLNVTMEPQKKFLLIQWTKPPVSQESGSQSGEMKQSSTAPPTSSANTAAAISSTATISKRPKPPIQENKRRRGNI